MTGPVPDTVLRERLAAVLHDWHTRAHSGHEEWECRGLADALLPVVQQYAAEKAAEALLRLRRDIRGNEDAATDAALEGLDFTLRVLAARAAALRTDTDRSTR
jgi:hypothetical protein